MDKAEYMRRYRHVHAAEIKAKRALWLAAHRAEVYERERLYRLANPEIYRQAVTLWNTNNAERRAAMRQATYAVRQAIKKGLLTRPTHCSRCNANTPIEAAHTDYSRPLDVIWLCRPCHRAFDKHDPKT